MRGGVCSDAAGRVAMKTVGFMGGRRAGHGMGMGEGPFAAVSLLEYGGLQPILPFLGGCSDAACRVVMKTVGLMGGRWAGESSRYEDPAPTVGVCGDALARRIAIPMLPLPPPCACHAAHGEPCFITEAEWEGRALEGGGYSGVGGQLSARPYSTAPTQNAIENLANG